MVTRSTSSGQAPAMLAEEIKTMARTYRNTPDTKQKIKRRKSKKNKASWMVFREQHRHTKAMDSSKNMNVARVVCR